ncbi:hypothetical protein KDL01_04675 [Actinospica durhamensis]|uniref:Uncharacterized protein n=1 Tax=Actinospica durhamensis TaxID=1508375 RepID=A0A941EP06_9ACTN|nr:hypothetical protein [Actinospica durhamensis]MBR7832539.1 hypothetical protein [Actinospica durhamensis]
MVVSDGTADHLYLSLANSAQDLAWTRRPVWTCAPFNAHDGAGRPIPVPVPLEIVDVFLSEASDAEHLVVDVLRDSGRPDGLITRYFLETRDQARPLWRPHDLPVDLAADDYRSRLGRSAGSRGVDGLYTTGTIGQPGRLIYTPLYNVHDRDLPPLTSRLHLPGDAAADAIATARNTDGTTDLYVAARGHLYRFAAADQKDGATGVPLLASRLLDTVRALYACTIEGVVTVWGVNGDDQVFYLTCPTESLHIASAWNTPLPVLSGVDAVSPYVDRAHGANTLFAHAAGSLLKVVKSPTTGLWNQAPITLPPPGERTPATPIHSYTTRIQVTDSAGRPAAHVPVVLTAGSVTPVTVNHLYYVVGPSPITLTADASGAITIVERTTTLSGTRYQAAVADQPARLINTMDTAWQRNAGYTTAESLRAAKIHSRSGKPRDFVPAGTSDQDLRRVAQANQDLATAYDRVEPLPLPTARSRPSAEGASQSASEAVAAAGFGVGLAVDLGDLCCWLATGVDAAVDLVEDPVLKAWHLVVKIGDTVHHAALDCVEAVMAAATWIYHAIEIAIEDIIVLLEFLFGWDDILVTHRVLHGVARSLAQAAVDGTETTRTEVVRAARNLSGHIDELPHLPESADTPRTLFGGNPPRPEQHSAPANLGVHHFHGGLSAVSGPDLLSITELSRSLPGIIAETVLDSAENMLGTLLDVIAQTVRDVLGALDAKIDIPVLSWLYHELTDDDPTILDLICLVAAIPVTLVYRAAGSIQRFAPGQEH